MCNYYNNPPSDKVNENKTFMDNSLIYIVYFAASAFQNGDETTKTTERCHFLSWTRLRNQFRCDYKRDLKYKTLNSYLSLNTKQETLSI